MPKEIKQVKSYSLPPSQIAWLRERARQESTPDKTTSASAVLERIIEEAMTKSAKHTPVTKQPNRRKTDGFTAQAVAA